MRYVKNMAMTEETKNKANYEPEIITFGCRLNSYESEVIRNHAKNNGLHDAIIFNTCAVTAEAERQARQAIRKASRENPEKKIFVTGCAVQVNPERFSDMSEIDRVIGNDLKLKSDAWRFDFENRVTVNDIMSVKETAHHLIEGMEGKTRAFVQVQNGCDHRCTFCIIPYGRGNSRSVPIGDIVEQIKALVDQGYREIVLTGVDITSYGTDLPGKPPLGQMIKRLLAMVPNLSRLRLSSLDPVEIDDDLWDLIACEPRFMPHLHISLQAGDNMILKRMKRRHLREDVIKICEKAVKLRPEIAFGADIITGFPTETDEMFGNTISLVKECNIPYLHVFPYSSRPQTPAAKMPQIPVNIRKERAKKLREVGAKQLNIFLQSLLSKTLSVIVEADGNGRSEEFASVMIPEKIKPRLKQGEIIKVKATSVDCLNGRIIGSTD